MAEDPRRPFDVFSGACPSREVLEHVTSRWGSLTLAALSPEPARFGELRRCVDGVSDVVVDIVWDPPWTRDRMSDAAKLQLGMF